MALFALIVWQALGLPEVEGPIPDRIGFDFILSLAGAGGVVGGVLSSVAWPRRREQFISGGTFAGFCAGVSFYALSLFVQLLSSP
jgi:hypothetical protein